MTRRSCAGRTAYRQARYARCVVPGLIALATIVPLVTHGAGDASDPAVVAIVTSDGVVDCSGTVIAPNFVLTAGHCIVPQIAQGASVVFGSTVATPSASIPLVASRVDPSFDPITLANDAAIVVLGAAAPATSIPLATAPPAVGSSLRIVGWGKTGGDAGDIGTKRSGTTVVTSVAGTTFAVAPSPSQPCEGDSGGPAFGATGDVVGITSHGDEACQEGAVYTRVDAVAVDFVAPTLAALGNGTAGTGQRCLYPEQCAAGAAACIAAADDPNVTYCSVSCTENADCTDGMLCVTIGESGSQCRYPFPTPGTIGSACTTDADCVEGTCMTGMCSATCVPGGQPCPGSSQCTFLGGIEFACTSPGPPLPEGGASCALTSPPAHPLCFLFLPAAVAVWRMRRRVDAARRSSAPPRR